MSRPRKEGLLYFPFDVSFFSDKKIKILKSRYGSDGLTLYIYLLCEIYKNGYYLKMDDDYEYIISDDLSMDSNKVKQVLNFLLERSLFEFTLFQSDKVLTSTGIQNRFMEAMKPTISKRVQRGGKPMELEESIWMVDIKYPECFIKVNPNSNMSVKKECLSGTNDEKGETNALNKRKENERNISSEGPAPELYFDNPDINNAFATYLAVRKNNGDRLMKEQILLLAEDLKNITEKDNERLAILNKAIMGNWKTLWPLKGGKGKPVSKNKFHNFDQRTYDMNELEKKLMEKQKK